MLKIARAALFAVLPAELLLVVLLLSGVSLPLPVIVGAELVVVAVFALEVVTAYRLFRAERRDGAGPAGGAPGRPSTGWCPPRCDGSWASRPRAWPAWPCGSRAAATASRPAPRPCRTRENRPR